MQQSMDEIDADRSSAVFMDVRVQVIRSMYIINMTLWFLVASLGMVLYYVLAEVDAPGTTVGVWTGFIICATAVPCVYAAMIVFPPHVLMLVGWAIALLGATTGAAVLSRSLVLLQAASIYTVQSMSMLTYTAVSRRYIDARAAASLVFGSGGVTWCLGIYVFVEQGTWISGSMLWVVILFTAAHTAYEIRHVDRYSISSKDAMRSFVWFYTDPVTVALEYAKTKMHKDESTGDGASEQDAPAGDAVFPDNL